MPDDIILENPSPTPAPVAPVVQAPAPTPVAAAQTPSTAVNVDIQSIISQAETKASEAAEKKMEAVFKSMLEQKGYDAEAVNAMTAEWKAKQVTPEQILKDKDTAIQERDGTISALNQQLETERREKIALTNGVPIGSEDETIKERVNACLTLANSFVSETVQYADALKKALGIIPFEVPPDPAPVPRFDGGNPAPVTKNETEELKEKYKKAVKLNNTAELVRLTRIAGEKKINIF